jgi:hypothetical protein
MLREDGKGEITDFLFQIPMPLSLVFLIGLLE